ncbi:MAG TPA: extracellular solute-binding protein [Roseiflexaceae bacterium]|nr:extracellular solute-binding protein [Roseiflexaceae bacterium]
MPQRSRSLLTLLSLLLALAGCGGPAAPPMPSAAPAAADTPAPDGTAQPVTIGFAAPEFERAGYQPLIDAFNAENPDVQVRFIALDEVAPPEGDSFDPAAVLRKTVSAADTAAPFFVRPEDASGLLLDLAPLMDADPSFDRSDFYPGALETLALDGAIYLLPRTISIPLIAYNRDLWAAAGVPPPTPGWTWEDLVAAAERLAVKRGDEVDTYGFVAPGAGFSTLLALLAAAGDPLAGADTAGARLDRPEVGAALRRVADLAEKGAIFAPGEDSPAVFQQVQELIRGGRAAMWPDGMLVTRPGSEAPPVNAGLAPLPSPTPASEGGPEASGYVISAGTQHPREAWRWLSYLSRQEVRRPQGIVMIGGGRTLPARMSIAEQSGFWKDLDAEATAAIEAAIARRAGTRPPDREAQAARQALSEALARVLQGEEPAAALTEVQALLEQRLAEAAPTATPAGPLTVATPEPDAAPAGATSVTFRAPGFDPARLRQLARAFSQENPAVYVDVQGGFIESGLDLARLAQQADCFMLPGSPRASDPLTATLDLRPLIDADASFAAADYPPALLAPFERGGALRGLPYGATLRAVTYNQDAFQAAGLEPPRADWTLADFLQAAQTLTTGTDERERTYGFASNGVQADDLRFFLDRMGARLAAGSGDTLRPTLTDQRVVDAARFYIDLLRNTSPHTRLVGYDRDEPLANGLTFELVEQGRVGMWFDFGLGLVRVVIGGPERRPFTRAIAPPPLGGDAATPNDVRVSGMYIAAGAQAPEACWAWLRYLSRDTSLLDGAFPARRSLAESPEFLARAQPGAAEVYAAYRAALDRPPASSGENPEAQIDPYWFFRAVDRAIQGGNLEQELAEAQRLTEQHLDCVRDGGGRAECAQAVDPEYGGFASDG